MSLPYPSMVFVPLDILTAEEMNQIVGNIESLAAGTGLNDGAVTSSKIDSTTYTISTSNTKITNLSGTAFRQGKILSVQITFRCQSTLAYQEEICRIRGVNMGGQGYGTYISSSIAATGLAFRVVNDGSDILVTSNNNLTSAPSWVNGDFVCLANV